MDELNRLQSDVDSIQRRLNELSGVGGDVTASLGAPGVPGAFVPPVTEPARPPASNLIRNGDFSHSANTWFETVAAPGTDKVLECANWFSHDGPPAAGDALDFIDAITSSVNHALKAPTHSTYNPSRCDWDPVTGQARMTGIASLDAPFPANSVFPNRPMYVGMVAARRNTTIVIQPDNHIAAMLYNNTPAELDFMKSGVVFHLDGAVRNDSGGAITTTQRKYKVLAKTDRGYEFISDELDLPAAPDDASFGPGVDVYLTWPRIDGVLSYEIYRHDITAAKFRLLYTVSSGNNSYGDNNHQDDDDVGGYPAGTDDRIVCYVATREGALVDLAVDGIAVAWDGLFLNIPVPTPLDKSGSGHQVLRLAMTKAMDRKMVDAISTAASPTIESATGEFSALDTGRIATLYEADGVTIIHGPEAITFVDATHVTFATNVASTEADVILYIEEGGDHGLLIDMVHVSYLSRAAYAPYFEDLNRALPSTAAPNTSTQGGIGPPGSSGDPGDGGIGGCITMNCPAWIYEGDRARSIPFELVRRGMAMVSGNLAPNHVRDIPLPKKTDNLHVIEFENGVWVPCSPGQPFFTSFTDDRGTAASRLQVGDYAITMRDGRVEASRIRAVTATGQSAMVSIPVLTSSHSFVAGYLHLPWHTRLWRWLCRKDRGASGAVLHNVKREESMV